MKLLYVFSVLVSLSSTTFAQTGIDLVIFNANVRTMASAQPRAEAIAVSGGEIVAVGSTKTILALADAETKRIDAQGKLVIPGFNDAHVHFAAIGNTFSSIKLADLKTPKQFADRAAHFARFLPKGRWILGSGWDNRNWLPNDPPTRALIDAVSPDNPVFIYNWDASAVLVNTAALKLAKIDTATKDPTGGVIVRDAKGETTGVLRGSAMQLIGKMVPQDHTRDLSKVLETATNYAASLGVTSVQDTHSDDISAALRPLAAEGKLKTRAYDCITLFKWKDLAGRKITAASGNAMVRTGCVKYFVEEEEDDIAQLERDIAEADKAGLQVAIHAIGSRHIQTTLTVFENVTKANGERDRRFRVEHARNADVKDLPRFAKLNAIASMQPWLFFSENSSANDDYKKIFGKEVRVAFGSDASMTELDPLLGIHAAVNSKNGVSVEQAVAAYTLGSAYAEFQEKIKGTIEVGKLADLVILSEDIFSIQQIKIREASVLVTIMDGRIVYETKF